MDKNWTEYCSVCKKKTEHTLYKPNFMNGVVVCLGCKCLKSSD